MARSVAQVATPLPGRYLGQFCKHFVHKLPVTLEARDELLVLWLDAADTAALDTLEDVVARHLLRFAFREPPKIRWVQCA